MQSANSSNMPSRPALVGLGLILTLGGCDRPEVISPEMHAAEHLGPVAVSNADAIQVIARHEGDNYVFDLSSDVIPAGWTTFELANHSSSTHFAYLARIPQAAIDGATEANMEILDYWFENVTRPFQFFMDTLIEGKEADPADLSETYAPDLFPHWFASAIPMGGPGFTQGHQIARTTMNLEPGLYIVECYVKDADGDFHSYDGMISLLEVDGDLPPSRATEPRPSLHVHLSTGQIEVDPEIRPGLHTVAVHFDDQPLGGYEHLLGHDVHLIRLDGDWDAEGTAEWMNWMVPEGLVSAEGMRGPSTFVGGAQTMSAGNTAYMTVRLEPGDYAWVSEVPASEGMWKAFTVPFGNAAPRR